MKASNKGALIKKMKQRVRFINCQPIDCARLHRAVFRAFLSRQAGRSFSAEVGPAACWTTAELQRRPPFPGGQTLSYRFYSATGKLSRRTKPRLRPSVRLPLREDDLASRNGRGTHNGHRPLKRRGNSIKLAHTHTKKRLRRALARARS